MLKFLPTNIAKNIQDHLLRKGRMIVVTNVCNMNCGGCCQLIGQFKKISCGLLN